MEFNTQDMNRMSQIARQMQGKSEDEVVRELARMIRSEEGGLSPGKAEQMLRTIQPMLNNEQRRKIQKLIRELQRG